MKPDRIKRLFKSFSILVSYFLFVLLVFIGIVYFVMFISENDHILIIFISTAIPISCSTLKYIS